MLYSSCHSRQAPSLETTHMFDSRRGFLRGFGAGVLGTAGLLLPTAAQAGLFRRGRGLSYPSPVMCEPSPVICELRLAVKIGPITYSYPNGSTIYGDGNFLAWGTNDPAYQVVSLDLMNGPNSSTLAPNSKTWPPLTLGASPAKPLWAVQCYCPPGTPFWLRFGYQPTAGGDTMYPSPYPPSSPTVAAWTP
jgi:hypothetical protein